MAISQRGSAIHRRAVLALLLIAFATFALIYAVQPTFALISAEFGTPASTTSLTLSVSTMVLALSVLPAARLSARVGRGRYMALSLALAILTTLGASLAPSMAVLLVLRALAGVGFAGVTGVVLAWVAEEASPLDVARIGGIYIAGTTVGGMAGRVLGGLAAGVAGWRGSLAIMAVLCAAVVLLAFTLLPRPGAMARERGEVPRTSDARATEPGGTPVDVPGATVEAPEAPEGARTTSRRPRGERRALALLCAVGCLGMFAFVGVFTAIVFRAAEPPLNLGPAATSLFFVTYLAGTATSAAAGSVAERLGLRRAMLLGLAIAVLGVLITIVPSPITVWLGLAVMSAGFFLAHALASATGPRIASAPGRASSSYTLWYYVGSSLGGVALGAAWDHSGWAAVVTAAVVAFAGAAGAVCAFRPTLGAKDVAR